MIGFRKRLLERRDLRVFFALIDFMSVFSIPPVHDAIILSPISANFEFSRAYRSMSGIVSVMASIILDRMLLIYAGLPIWRVSPKLCNCFAVGQRDEPPSVS